MHKGNCKAHIMVVSVKRRFVISIPHSKEQLTGVETLAYHGYSGIMMVLKLTTFSKERKHLVGDSSQHVWTQLKKYGKDFAMMASYLGHGL